MTGKTHRLKALGLALTVALGLMAMSAVAAQASGEFLLKGSTFTSLGIASETVKGTGLEGELLVTGLKLEINCTSSDIKGTIFLGGTALAEVTFLGCTVLGNNFCKVYMSEADRNAKANVGQLLAIGKGLLELLGGNHYLLLEEDGTSFTTVWFSKSTEGCTLNSNEKVNGSTVFKIEDALTSQKTHSIVALLNSEISALGFKDVLTYGTGGQLAELHKGLATLELSGVHAGESWSAE